MSHNYFFDTIGERPNMNQKNYSRKVKLTRIDASSLKEGVKKEEWKFKYLTSNEIPPMPFEEVPCLATFLDHVVNDYSWERSEWIDVLLKLKPINCLIKAAFSEVFLDSLLKMKTPILFPVFKEHEHRRFLINYLTYGRLNFNSFYQNHYVMIFNILQIASGTKQTLYTFDSIQNGLKMVQYSINLELKIQEEEFNNERSYKLFEMHPLKLNDPKRNQNEYGDFPLLNIAVYDHHCMALPETLNQYLEGYRQLINYPLFHPLIYLKFPGRF
ncbi:hypothetical protein HMI55_005171 [Coelomomyces lativittatus]|nr:hypothetical protein HMI55_005171 [Coelomomyces lativittatus]